MTTYKLFRKQFIPISRYRAWDFFSSPKYLLLVTPRRLNLKVQDFPDKERMYDGQIIKHRVTVLPFVTIDWETVVTDLRYYECFTLRQKKGPYSHWVHKHGFRPVPGGVEMTDDVEYGIPLPGMVSKVMHAFLLKRELNQIFDYRALMIHEYFGNTLVQSPPRSEHLRAS